MHEEDLDKTEDISVELGENDLLQYHGLPQSFGAKQHNHNTFRKQDYSKVLSSRSKAPSGTSPHGLKTRPTETICSSSCSGENSTDVRATDDKASLVSPQPTGMPSKRFPISKNVLMSSSHAKSVVALALNSKASRMITGGSDSLINLWDFHTCFKSSNPEKAAQSITPEEGHSIQSLSYSCTGSHFLCAGGSSSCQIYDSNGRWLQATMKGDMYIRDMSNTKGHTHMITACQFSPAEGNNRLHFATASVDGTVRLWDSESMSLVGLDHRLPHLRCFKATDKRGQNKCPVVALEWEISVSEGAAQGSTMRKHLLLGACADGSVQMWAENAWKERPEYTLRDAHVGEIRHIRVFNDGNRFATRGEDDTIKLWDLRKLTSSKISTGVGQSKTLIHSWAGIVGGEKYNFAISPLQDVIVAGFRKRSEVSKACGKLVFLDVTDLEKPLVEVPVEDAAVVRVEWPGVLNQIFASRSDGKVICLYDDELSAGGGAFLAAEAIGKRAGRMVFDDNEDTVSAKQAVYTMDSLPEGLKETRGGNIKRIRLWGKDKEEYEREKFRTIVPPRPSSAYGSVMDATNLKMDSQSSGSKFSSSHPLLGKILSTSIPDQDSVEVLRSFANEADKNPRFISKAYEKTQPKVILDYSMKEEDEQEFLRNESSEKCPRCGLKLCQCGYMRVQNVIKGVPSKKK